MIKRFTTLTLLLFLSLFSLYLVFLSVISIAIGLINTHRHGFWMPIVSGLFILWLATLTIRLILYTFRQIKAKE